jgi:hypothetical protein
MSQQEWHVKKSSLLKTTSAKHRSKFDSRKIAENCGYKQSNKLFSAGKGIFRYAPATTRGVVFCGPKRTALLFLRTFKPDITF